MTARSSGMLDSARSRRTVSFKTQRQVSLDTKVFVIFIFENLLVTSGVLKQHLKVKKNVLLQCISEKIRMFRVVELEKS